MKYTDEKLRELCDAVESTLPDWVPGWRQSIATLLREVAEAPDGVRSSKAFQRTLWESEAITSTGMGQVKTGPALEDDAFRTWLAEHGMKPLPDGEVAKAAHLKQMFDRLVAQFEGHRTPWLKILRLLAALYPTEFTTLAYRRMLHELASWILDAPPRGSVAANRAIVRRLDEVLGPVAVNDYEGLATRMSLPRLLHLQLISSTDEEEVTETVDKKGEARLQPLPAARRRKGLTAFKGYFQSMLAMLQAVEGGLSREDLIDFLRTERPDIKDSSHVTTITVLQGEFGVIQRDGALYRLTPTGRAVLETGDPDELAPWLLTHVLGVDLALLQVRDHGPIKNVDLKRAIQKANPGWTGLFVPSAIVSWLAALDLIKRDEGRWLLTERGEGWAQQVTWPPAILEPVVDPDNVVDGENESVDKQDPDSGGVRLPAFEELYARLTYKFPRALVAELHAGIWSNPCRHFAVLTGLSGAGKTQLARQYGLALIGQDERARAHVKVIPVQPGWYDPGPLLGYINPIRPDAYVQTPVLEFLRRAVNDPATPYVLVLDEMNLSHPEQYLAPLLSAMETGDSIDLHAEGDFLDGVECRIPYPRNLVLIGTVNMDETTHGLSDKVLDRAYTIEFWDIDINEYSGWDRAGLIESETKRLRELLAELMGALKPARLHFGWRVLDDVVQFLARVSTHGGGQLKFSDALDAIVYAKIIPKLRGDDSPRFRAALEATLQIATSEKLKRCKRKLEELQLDLASTGSARFWR